MRLSPLSPYAVSLRSTAPGLSGEDNTGRGVKIGRRSGVNFESRLTDHPKTCPPASSASPREPAQSSVQHRRGQVRYVVRLADLPALGRSNVEALAAVRSFVGMLERAPDGGASGSALAEAYASRRSANGWPTLAPNTFGRLLKIAVHEAGGRKLKSGGQIYEGVRIPAEWRMKAAA